MSTVFDVCLVMTSHRKKLSHIGNEESVPYHVFEFFHNNVKVAMMSFLPSLYFHMFDVNKWKIRHQEVHEDYISRLYALWTS